MSKVELTKQMEYALYLSCLGQNGRIDLVKRYGVSEVGILVERKPNYFQKELIDFVTFKNGEIRCYEIKQSINDLKSKCALTFIGHYNYLVIPKGFYIKHKEDIEKRIETYVGVIEIDRTKLEYIRKSKYKEVDKHLEEEIKTSLIATMFYKMQKGKKY